MRRRRSSIVWACAASAIAGGAIVWTIDRGRVQALADDCGNPDVEVRPSVPLAAPPVPAAPPLTRDETPSASVSPISDLRARRLTLPVQGLDRKDLRSSFDEQRGDGRRHEAMDVLSPRNTPVVAVDDGTIAKLFTSKAGGLTVYQFDPNSVYAYYYAHLERYASGLEEHQRVKRGDVIGYVGTSGNAPPDTPHLHFAIFRLTEAKEWWKGTAIDPFLVLR
jgi:murein DD-endopeptidase MepM/ murein hydrolase activator NlpD